MVDCEEIFLVDSTGAAALSHYHAYAERYGVDLRLTRVHSGTHELLTLAGVVEEIGEDRFHDTVRGAVDAAVAKTTDRHRDSPSA